MGLEWLSKWEPVWLFYLILGEFLAGLVMIAIGVVEVYLLWRFASIRQKDAIRRQVRQLLKTLRLVKA